jgi:hypothetical protein
MTRSLANCSADGAAIDSPGGGPFLREVMGVFVGLSNTLSASPLPPVFPFCLFSINLLCCSLMFIALSICSLIVGSCVLKPGERHATPTSCRRSPALSLDVSGPADGRAESAPAGAPFDMLELERLSRLGRCRPVGRSGDVGSFLTMTFGTCAALLRQYKVSASHRDKHRIMLSKVWRHRNGSSLVKQAVGCRG